MIDKSNLSFQFDSDNDFEFVSFSRDTESTLAQRDGCTLTTEEVASEAQKAMDDMRELLHKMNSNTASCDDKNRLRSLNAKLSQMKQDIGLNAEVPNRDVEILRARAMTKTNDLIKSIRIKDIKNITDAICASESVDLAFIVDSTGSMGPYIESVKSNIKVIVEQIRRTNINLNLRLAVIAYRDIGDHPQFEVLDFNKSIDCFENFVSCLEATGGGDAPEDIAGAIQKANGLSWMHPTRVAFLIADYPCHGQEFHRHQDNYPDGTPGIDIVQELRFLLGQHLVHGTMSLKFGRIGEATDLMISRLQEQYDINLDVVPVDDSNKMKASVTSSVRRSVFKTMTICKDVTNEKVNFALPSGSGELVNTVANRGSRACSIRAFSLVDTFPSLEEWKIYPPTAIKVYRNVKIKSVDALRAPIGFAVLRRKKTEKTVHSTMMMRRAPNPFAQGETRIAYHGQLARTSGDLHLDKSAMVMKVFKYVGRGVNTREQYLKQMEVSNIAHYLSELYNNNYRASHCSAIHFLPVCVVEQAENSREKFGDNRLCVEPPLPNGAFQKFSNNTGYWDETIIDETLLRFTIWTHDVTDGYLMVTDLQGVNKDGQFYLTDPVVLCKDITRFGSTNLGETFMQRCIQASKAHMSENGW